MAQRYNDDLLYGVQQEWEVSLTLGANNFLGDLGGTPGIGGTFKDYTLKTIQPLAGLSVMYNPSSIFAIKGGFNYTGVKGVDSLIKNTGNLERWRIYRNLSFKSSIAEAYLTVVIYPYMLFDHVYEVHQLAPFIEVGVGIFHFNPKALLNGSWIPLQPLSLEGEGFAEYPDRNPYKLTQIYIPVNIGAKFYLNNKYAVSGGLALRHTSTDYIDDISTAYIDPNLFDRYLPANEADLARQLYSRSIRPEKVAPDILKANSNNNDTYLTFFATISMRLTNHAQFYYGHR